MSSACCLTVPCGCIDRDQWELFAETNHIVYSPHTVGGQTYYCGQVEIRVDDRLPDWEITFSTFFRDPSCTEVARLASAAWRFFRAGSMTADPEILSLLLGGLPTTAVSEIEQLLLERSQANIGSGSETAPQPLPGSPLA